MVFFRNPSKGGYEDWNKILIEEGVSPNFPVIKTERLDAGIVRRAVGFLKDPHVVNVQIEIPASPDLRNFVKGLDNKRLFTLQHLPPSFFMSRLVPGSQKFLNNFFNAQAKIYRDDRCALQLIEKWRQAVLPIPAVLHEVMPDVTFTTFVRCEGVQSLRPGHARLHTHERNPYVFNFLCATDGTVFTGKEERTLWFSKGWTYNLFKGTTPHGEPPPFQAEDVEPRKTFIFPILSS